MTIPTRRPTLLAPTRRAEYQRAVRLLQSVALRGAGPRVVLLGDRGQESRLSIPIEALRMFRQILELLAEGHAVTVAPHHTEATTQQAADLLGVSRPYLIKLVDEGRLPCRRVGNRRKIRTRDVLAYRKREDDQRRKVADELTQEGEELGLGY